MKNFLTIAALVLIISSCKKGEEVKIDETQVETPADTIVANDTVAASEVMTEEVTTTEVAVKEIAKSDKKEDVNYAVFGSKFNADKALSRSEMLKKYKSLKKGDTVAVKFKSTIKNVCKKKGCWMAMELPESKESFVRFKDYAFFVPLNADDSEAIVSGKAYIDVVSVAELQHYAKDGGKSDDEIAQITEPKVTYAFQADGVLIKE